MATKWPPSTKPGKMQSRVPKEGWLDIITDCQPGTDKWDKANFKRRYCELHRDSGLSLKVYDNDKKTGTPHTLQLDTALHAAKRGRCQVVTEDGTVLCVMEGDERVSDWVISLNSVITTASTDKDIAQHTDSETDRERETDTDSATAEGEDAGTAPHRSRQLSEEPKVIKRGWLNIFTDPAPGEDKLDNMQTEYCSLQRQGDRYRLEVYKEEDDWWRYDRFSYTYWTGNVATVCLDTARHAQLCSRYEVITMDGGAIFLMDGTDDVMTDWVVSLNRAIMAARCRGQTGNSESHDDVIGVDRDDSDDGTLEQGIKFLSPAQAENEFLHAWSPPSVVREVEQARHMKDGTVPPYTEPPVAPPCDGPPVITITHYRKGYSGDREGHQPEGEGYDDVPWRCEECGRRVAHLLHTLHLGRHDNGPGEQGGLRYNDVFIMGLFIDCAPDTPDDDGKSPAPFIRGLRQLGIPTRAVHHGDSEAVRRMAENSWTPLGVADAVTIVKKSTVWGLERKVAVFLDSGLGVGAARTGRLISMSRSTAQLVWVKSGR